MQIEAVSETELEAELEPELEELREDYAYACIEAVASCEDTRMRLQAASALTVLGWPDDESLYCPDREPIKQVLHRVD